MLQAFNKFIAANGSVIIDSKKTILGKTLTTYTYTLDTNKSFVICENYFMISFNGYFSLQGQPDHSNIVALAKQIVNNQ